MDSALIKNLKQDCCVHSLNITLGNNNQIKLYDTIKDACLENGNFKFYDFPKIANLNSKTERPKGIVCHKCKSGKCILSLRINKKQHTRFYCV
jgi:hypothetical protein